VTPRGERVAAIVGVLVLVLLLALVGGIEQGTL
jgi:hypothetical protein